MSTKARYYLNKARESIAQRDLDEQLADWAFYGDPDACYLGTCSWCHPMGDSMQEDVLELSEDYMEWAIKDGNTNKEYPTIEVDMDIVERVLKESAPVPTEAQKQARETARKYFEEQDIDELVEFIKLQHKDALDRMGDD